MKFILYRNPESRAQKIPFPAMQAAELADAEELTVQTGAGSILISRKNLTVRQALTTLAYPQKGVCLYKCGNDRHLLAVHAPPHKEKLFGSAGGR